MTDLTELVDLAAIENGGHSVVCSDMFFGHRQNLIMPGRSTHMGNGWETKRRRGPGHDWTIIRLARLGTVKTVELSTDHYKGNAPGGCMLEYTNARGATADARTAAQWKQLVPRQTLKPYTRHRWPVSERTAATHVRLNIYPDEGVARLRLLGLVATSA